MLPGNSVRVKAALLCEEPHSNKLAGKCCKMHKPRVARLGRAGLHHSAAAPQVAQHGHISVECCGVSSADAMFGNDERGFVTDRHTSNHAILAARPSKCTCASHRLYCIWTIHVIFALCVSWCIDTTHTHARTHATRTHAHTHTHTRTHTHIHTCTHTHARVLAPPPPPIATSNPPIALLNAHRPSRITCRRCRTAQSFA